MSQQESFYKVYPIIQDQNLIIPFSKSYLTRLLILGSLIKEKVEVFNYFECSDVVNLKKALEKIGIEILKEEDKISIINSFPECELGNGPIDISPGDGGTTNRFLLGLLGRGKKQYRIHLDKGILLRPMEEILNALVKHGVDAKKDDDLIIIRGPFATKITNVQIDCSMSTQFLSSIKMALIDRDIKYQTKSLSSSYKYLEITDRLITRINNNERSFFIPSDMSALAYPVAYSMLGKKVRINNYLEDSLQPDFKIVDIAKFIGIKINKKEETIIFKGDGNYSSFEVDLNDCLDLAPVLSFMATLCEGTSKLKNLKQLAHKESNRLEEILKLLTLFNVKHEYNARDDVLKISQSSPIQNYIKYYSKPDHRMIMTAYLFMKRNAGGEIYNFQHVEKSWPCFFNNMDQVSVNKYCGRN